MSDLIARRLLARAVGDQPFDPGSAGVLSGHRIPDGVGAGHAARDGHGYALRYRQAGGAAKEKDDAEDEAVHRGSGALRAKESAEIGRAHV